MAKTKTSKKQSEKVVEKVEEKVEETVEEPVEESMTEIDQLKTLLTEIQDKVSSLDEVTIKDFTKVKKELTTLVKNTLSHTKKVEKVFNKNTKTKKKRKVTTSGFDKPVVLTGAAKTFITKHCKGEVTDTLSRRDVNKYIHSYIKDNNLQNPENRRQIKPDNNLKKILSELSKEKNKNGTVDYDVGYNYFNLQRYIKHIFVAQN